MICTSCGTEWSISIQGNSVQRFCPACGKPVVEVAERKLTSLEETLLLIKKDYGIGVLQDNARIVAFFSDLAPQLRKEKVLLKHLLQCNGNTLLISALSKPPAEQQLCIQQLKVRLMEDIFLTEAAAQMICTSFWNAITDGAKQEIKLSAIEIVEESCEREEQEEQESLRLLKRAAEGGVFSAQAKLAQCYRDGRVVEKNPKKAFYWYRKAAASQEAKAQCNLGWCYATGFGCAVDPVMAATYFQKAAASGLASGQYNLARCHEKGSGIRKDLPLAASLYEKAAKAKHVKAQYHLGRCYERGIGLAEDISLAIYWYKKAADGGCADAQFSLGSCYEFGKGFDRDADIAYYWYKKAADNGHLEAKVKLTKL